MPLVSFEKDLVPIFHQFRASMMWRFDLTKYEDVKANSSAIIENLKPSGGQPPNMPPPPYPPFTKDQVDLFQQWINDGYPR